MQSRDYISQYPTFNFIQNSCGDSSGTLTLNFSHMVSQLANPLSLSFLNRPFSSDTVFNNIKTNSTYLLKVKTKAGCIANLPIYVPYPYDSVRLSGQFRPDSCGKQNGTLSLFIDERDTLSNVLLPLSISFDGRPFTTNTVFENVKSSNTYDVLIKSKQGCDLRTRFYVDSPTPITLILEAPCANRFGRTDINPIKYGGVLPYNYRWSNGMNNHTLIDMPIGTYTLTVTDAIGCHEIKTISTTTCVWAGDTDTSGIVNQDDLLNIGLAYGDTGSIRCPEWSGDSCIFWYAQNAYDWSKQTPNKVNLKHIDTNGDGIINAADTLAIKLNWSKTRNFRNEPVLTPRNATPLYIQTNSIGVNQWGAFPVMLGDATNAANGVYGLAFSIKYDPSVIEANSVYFTHNQSWLGTNNELLSLFNNENGQIDIGLTKTNHNNASGKGQIGTIHFKIKNNALNKPLNFNILEPKLIDNNAVAVPANPIATSTTITSTVEPQWASEINIQPNPTHGIFYINGNETYIQQVKIFDISGKLISIIQNINRDTPLSIEPVGTFFLHIQTDKGMLIRKIMRLK